MTRAIVVFATISSMLVAISWTLLLLWSGVELAPTVTDETLLGYWLYVIVGVVLTALLLVLGKASALTTKERRVAHLVGVTLWTTMLSAAAILCAIVLLR